MTDAGPTRIALIDSGVNTSHPHIRAAGTVVIGPSVDASGVWGTPKEQTDVLGHGTAVAAAILDLAPGAEIVSIQVFRDEPTCPFEHVLAALERALECEPQLVNLSVGTTRREWAAPLGELVRRAQEAGVTIVAPATAGGLPSLPGCLAGVTGAMMDANVPRECPELRTSGSSRLWYASPYPRDLEGLPRASNLAGVSMAAANLTGYLAREHALTPPPR